MGMVLEYMDSNNACIGQTDMSDLFNKLFKSK